MKSIALALLALIAACGCQGDPEPEPAATKFVPEAKNGGTVPSPNGQFNQTSDRN